MRTKKAIINISVGILSFFLTTFISFFGSALFARTLGVEISGLNNVLMNIISFLSVTELGIAGAINYNLYKPAADRDYVAISKIMSFYRRCYMVIGYVILFASVILSFFVHLLMKDTTLSNEYIQLAFLLCAANTVLSYFLAYNRNLLYAFQEIYISSFVDMIFRLIGVSLQIAVLIKLRNFHLYLVISLFQTFASNFVITLITRKRHSQVITNDKTRDASLERKVFRDVRSLATIQIGSAMINFTSSIIISKMIGIVEAGMYAYHSTIIVILTNFVNMMFNNLGASIGNLLAEDKQGRANEVFKTLTHVCLLLGLIFASGLANAIRPFILFWVGDEYVLDYSIIVVLAINFFIMVQRQVINYFLRTGGYHAEMVKPLIFEAVINLTCSIILAHKMGLIGVFLGCLISSLVGWPMNIKTLCSNFNLSFSRCVGSQVAYLVFFVLQMFISQWIISNLNLQCSLIVQFVISGFISVVIPIVVCVFDVMCNPALLSIRNMIFGIMGRAVNAIKKN